ncbi:hypothetical protein GP486_004588 [Trichoglossum hirsutum]|uniref:Vezatin n=1 Tax=Trichoglossum hirsutum TaxID=265104 RepID=A0A9P8LAW8_9PEZI|nr:hypothetical protein GP486_004588 [Trichoglossum hirsutum]
MESVVFKDSPLAEYLEGEGAGDPEWVPSQVDIDEPLSPKAQSFAPCGPPTIQARFRERWIKPARWKAPPKTAVTRLHDAFSSAINSRLGRAENAHFLEQFRYIIVASQLLNEHINVSHYNPMGHAQQQSSTDLSHSGDTQDAPFNLTLLVATGVGAYAFAWMIHWARGSGSSRPSKSRIIVVFSLFVIMAMVLYAYVRRQWLQYLRRQSVDAAAMFVESSQAFDVAASAAVTLIQEVEVVSRGYRMQRLHPSSSTPLPPITRLEERSQSRRCLRLRQTLCSCLGTAISSHSHSYALLRHLAEEVDLAKYHDIYDINAADLEDADRGYSDSEFDDPGTLKALKVLLYRLHTTRRAFLCCLLALDADGGKPDFARWRTAADEIEGNGAAMKKSAEMLGKFLIEDQQFTIPQTPKSPLNPGKERWRTQVRKLNSLSQGIRGLQAKMHVLREECDRSLDESADVTELGANLIAQYESIGEDLKMLTQEWEIGKAALALNIDKNERRISQSSSGWRLSTSSIGGATAVEGGPQDALRSLNGDDNSRSSLEMSTSDNEEVFEAVASPRQRNKLTREERIAKMQEERLRVASAREKSDANTNMLRELESVISLKQLRGRPPRRITSI